MFDEVATFEWRFGILNNLFLSVPFIVLFVFSIMERKLDFVNKRVYVAGIFGIYAIQAIAYFFFDEAPEFSVLSCSVLDCCLDISTIIMIVRIIILLIIPVAHKIILKLYSLGMVAFLIGFLCITLTSNYLMLSADILLIYAIIVDILFHIGLYFFNELIDKDNKSDFWIYFIGALIYPFFGNSVEDDEECNEDVDLDPPYLSYASEYKALFIEALNEEDNEFLLANQFLKNLSNENCIDDNGKIYSTNDFVSNLNIIAKKIENINTTNPTFFSNEFKSLIDLLIAEKDEKGFKMDVIAISKILFEENTSQWISAARKHTENTFVSSKKEP